MHASFTDDVTIACRHAITSLKWIFGSLCPTNGNLRCDRRRMIHYHTRVPASKVIPTPAPPCHASARSDHSITQWVGYMLFSAVLHGLVVLLAAAYFAGWKHDGRTATRSFTTPFRAHIAMAAPPKVGAGALPAPTHVGTRVADAATTVETAQRRARVAGARPRTALALAAKQESHEYSTPAASAPEAQAPVLPESSPLPALVMIEYAISNQNGRIPGAKASHTWQSGDGAYMSSFTAHLPAGLQGERRFSMLSAGSVLNPWSLGFRSIEVDRGTGGVAHAIALDTFQQSGAIRIQSDHADYNTDLRRASPIDMMGLAYALAAYVDIPTAWEASLIGPENIQHIHLAGVTNEDWLINKKNVVVRRYQFLTWAGVDVISYWLAPQLQPGPLKIKLQTTGGQLIFEALDLDIQERTPAGQEFGNSAMKQRAGE
jgi:hypothetical protein